MLVNRASLEALAGRRDRFHLTFANIYEGRVDGYAASLVKGSSPLVSLRLRLGAIADADRADGIDEVMLIAVQCARTEAGGTAAWTALDRRDQERIRMIAKRLAAKASARLKVDQMRGSDQVANLPSANGDGIARHLDVLSLPSGRVCLINFGRFIIGRLQPGSWLVARTEMSGRTLILSERMVSQASGDIMERTVARVDNCDRILVELVMAHRFVDLVTFRPDASFEQTITERDFEVLQFRTEGVKDGEMIEMDPEAAVLLDRLVADDDVPDAIATSEPERKPAAAAEVSGW